MKKMIMMAMMMAATITANAMSYSKAKGEALFLSDQMAYELNLTDAQFDAVYEINLDYLLMVNGRNDVYGRWWNRRNSDLMYVLTAWQYNQYVAMDYFYRPLAWAYGDWTFTIYKHYTNHNHSYRGRPKAYTSYRGGNNQKGDRYYADKKVDKPRRGSDMRHGDDKDGHPGNNAGHNSNGHADHNNSHTGQNNVHQANHDNRKNDLMASNNGNAHHSVRGGTH